MLFALVFSAISAQPGLSAGSCSDEGELSFEGWKNWLQVTQKPVMSIAHGNNWVRIFVDALARDTYLSAGAPYPECAKIVKPIYYDAEGQLVRKLTIMVNMPAGYDPENGDWWYATSDPSGTKIEPKIRRAACIVCHEQAAETDYLFSKDVLEAAKE